MFYASLLFMGCHTASSRADLITTLFERSFGSARLNTSFGSSVALGRALEHENQHLDAMDLTISNTLGCATYQDGLDTGNYSSITCDRSSHNHFLVLMVLYSR